MLAGTGAVCPHTTPLHRCGFGRNGSCRMMLTFPLCYFNQILPER